MRNLHHVGCVLVATGLLSACHTASSSAVIPLAGTAVASEARKCVAKGESRVTICVRVPEAGAQVTVTDTIYGDDQATVGTVTCPGSGSAYLCAASFRPPKETLNQLQVVASGNTSASVAFPVFVGKGRQKETVVLEGGSLLPIASLSVYPFHSVVLGEASSLPLGQEESVWIVARDASREIIAGHYKEHVSISATKNALASPTRLGSSEDAEQLAFKWRRHFPKGQGSASATLTAATNSRVTASSEIDATSGVIYYRVGGNDPRLGPGPVALSPDGKYVYFVINDDSDRGCQSPGHCRTELERFSKGSLRLAPAVSLRDVPGVSQLYVTSDGALWMATFQPVGAWNHPLPGLRMPPHEFNVGDLQTLPAGFGEPSGFVADGYGNLWVSSCEGRDCKQNQKGQPILVKTSIEGSHKPESTVDLPKSCMKVGYVGYSVGDVANYDGFLYVLGINDGSAPPARGNIWRVAPASLTATCTKVPANFNPSPYFSLLTNSAGVAALVFGAGGNNANFHWKPNHGFYVLIRNGSQDRVRWDSGPIVTANHVSASPPPSGAYGSVLYYASSGKLDLRFSGLGTYEPSVNPAATPSAWAIFPSASFSGDESDNGVAADHNGAWYTANGVCGTWTGVCLAHAIYEVSSWGALPGLNLDPIRVGNSAGFGVIINPLVGPSGSTPLNAHSGPFYAQTKPSSVCTSQPVNNLTFVVYGLTSGVCQITIQEKKYDKVIRSQPLVTSVRE